MERIKVASIDEYLERVDEPGKSIAQNFRRFLNEQLPDAQELISYGMPAFKTTEVLVYFAVNKKHLGFYPTGKGIEAFAPKLIQMGLTFSKGAIQFPYEEEIPFDLVKEIAIFRKEHTKVKTHQKK